MCQDLETGPDLAYDFLCGLRLPSTELASPHTLLKAEQDCGGCQEAGGLVGEVVVQTGIADDGLGHTAELLHVDRQREVEAGQHVVQVVKSRARAQLPAQLREDQQLPLLKRAL